MPSHSSLPQYLAHLIVLLCISSTLCWTPSTGCTPFGPRLSLGLSFHSNESSQRLLISFNTNQKCPKSFITLETSSSISKIYCTPTAITIKNYSSFVQKCSINSSFTQEIFEYLPYGWSGNSTDPKTPYSSQNIKAKMVGKSDIKMVSLADWGFLEEKVNTYDSLDDSFSYLLKNQSTFDLLYIGGDMAYDLSSNYGKNYEQFLIMLSKAAAYRPVIIVPGNHEYNTKLDYEVMNKSFELYNIYQKNVTFLNINNLKFILLDPFNIIFNNGSAEITSQQLQKILKQAKQQNKITVAASHYPLACSGESIHCKQERVLLKQLFDKMGEYHTVLYIGSHYHTYQRLYPFAPSSMEFQISEQYKNGHYSIKKQQKLLLVAVVEGIAGNDKDIIQKYGSMQNFTAAVSYGKTGYGIVTIKQKQMTLTFQHYQAMDYVHNVDSIVIDYSQLFLQQKKINLRAVQE